MRNVSRQPASATEPPIAIDWMTADHPSPMLPTGRWPPER